MYYSNKKQGDGFVERGNKKNDRFNWGQRVVRNYLFISKKKN